MATTIEGIRFFTIVEVTELLNVTRQTVRSYIKKEKLKAVRIGRSFLITETSLQNFLKGKT